MRIVRCKCRVIILFFSIGLFLTGCKNAADKNVNRDSIAPALIKDISIPGGFSTNADLRFDTSRIKSFLEKYPHLIPLKNEIDSFYRNRKYSFAWFDKAGMIEQAANLHNRMENINDEGLPDKIPYKTEFSGLMQNNGLDSTDKPSVYTELMLTAQYFVYAKNVWQGLSEKQSRSLNWYLPRKKASYYELLDSLINGKDILDSAPVYRQYILLKQYLKKYRDIETGGGWPLIKADKKIYKVGDSSIVIVSIRKFLFLTGDLNRDTTSLQFDSTLEQGVKNFQHRMGEKEDGVVGPAVLTAMNFSVNERIEQIAVNIERSRWVPVNLRSNYLVVNIPEYRLHVYENDMLVWSMDVVVGQSAHKTVVFNGNIQYVVFSPYWYVPPGILRNEILPGIRRNKNYLANHNMEWNGGNVRQRPGPNNSLGLVKFLFPNSYDIYLHDTPAKSLFGESTRAFSHGCIRLAEPLKLAEYLLQNDSAWGKKKINAAMHSGREKTVILKNPEPVFIAYFTAWVDRQGKLNFRKDVYDRDSRLAKAILDRSVL